MASEPQARRRTSQCVTWLCRHFPDAPPALGATFQIRRLDGTEMRFSAGKFLDRIRLNWLATQRFGTRLTKRDKTRVEAMPWFPSWHVAILRRGGVKANVSKKVDLLCRLWPGREAPVQGHPRRVPEALREGGPEMFDGAKFLDHIKLHWLGRRPNTSL